MAKMFPLPMPIPIPKEAKKITVAIAKCFHSFALVAIATSAPIPNVNLYFDEYELFRWFDWDHIIMVADDCPAKPHPALFQHAIKQIQVAPEHTVVFEDSAVGMEAAYRAGVRHIIHITGDSPAAEKEKEMPGVIRKISDYTELKMDEMND